jgi:hypothetical protein
VVLSRVHPLLEFDPAERTPARQETTAAEAVAWLKDPPPLPPPEALHDYIACEIAEAIGWPLEHVQEAITELHEPGLEEEKGHGVPADLVGGGVNVPEPFQITPTH